MSIMHQTHPEWCDRRLCVGLDAATNHCERPTDRDVAGDDVRVSIGRAAFDDADGRETKVRLTLDHQAFEDEKVDVNLTIDDAESLAFDLLALVSSLRAATCPRCGSSNANHLGSGYHECCACGHGWGAW